MNKARNLLILSLILVATFVSGQGIRLHGYTGYVFDDSFDSFYSSTSFFRGKVIGGFQGGAGLEFLLQDEYGIELMYIRQDTDAPVNYWSQEQNQEINRTLDVTINYYMLGGVRYLQTGEMFEPYGGAMLGAVTSKIQNPLPGEQETATRFGWGFRLGSNIWASERVGLKVQAMILSAVQSAGGGFYIGTGGVGTGVSTYSTFFQLTLGGGLIFKLK